MVALAPPFDSLTNDHDLLASYVVDFTPVREVTVFEPRFKTWLDAIATRSVSLLKPPLHGDSFSDNSTTHAVVAVRGVRQSTTTPRVTPFFGIDSNLTPLQGYYQPPSASGASVCALASPCARRLTPTLTNARRSRRRW
jgi:hypothetical protein